MTSGLSVAVPSVPLAGRLLRLNAQCPSCGASPALRVTETAVTDARYHAADEPLATYRCQRRRCGIVYELRAGAFQEAA